MCKLFTLVLLCPIFMISIGVSAVVSPPCHIACFDNLIKTGPCGPIDAHCLCMNNESISTVQACVCQNCSGADIQDAVASANEFCLQEAGVSLHLKSCRNVTSPSSASLPSTVNGVTVSAPTRTVTSSSAVRITGTIFIVTAASLAALAL